MRELEEYLREAAGELRDSHLSSFPERPPEHTFSKEFERNMQAMLERERLGEKRVQAVAFSRRVVSFVAAAVLGIFASVASVGAWSGRFFEMVEERYPDHTRITFRGENTVQDGAKLFYELPQVPAGFRRVQHGRDPINGFINYAIFENEQDQSITFHQSPASGIAIGLNTEGAQMEEIQIGGKPGKFLENRGHCNVIWYDDRYCYMLSTNLPRQQALALAESVRLKAYPYPTMQTLPIESLPEQYPVSLALSQGDVVLSGQERHNLEKLTAFITACNEKKDAAIRLVQYRGEAAVVSDLQTSGGRIYHTRDEHRWSGSEQPFELGEEFEGISILEGGGKKVLLLHTRRYPDPVEVAVLES